MANSVNLNYPHHRVHYHELLIDGEVLKASETIFVPCGDCPEELPF